MNLRKPNYSIQIWADEWVVIDTRDNRVVYRSDNLSDVREWLSSREDYP